MCLVLAYFWHIRMHSACPVLRKNRDIWHLVQAKRFLPAFAWRKPTYMYEIDGTLREEWIYRWLGNVTHSNRPPGIRSFSFFRPFFSGKVFPTEDLSWKMFLYESSVLFGKALFHVSKTIKPETPTDEAEQTWVHTDYCSPSFCCIVKEKLIFHRNIVLPHPVIQLLLKPTFKTLRKLWKMCIYLTKRGPNQLKESHPNCRLGYRNLEDWKT